MSSSLSMAASSIASPPLHTKISNHLCFTHSPLPTHFSPKPFNNNNKPLTKPLKLTATAQIPNSISLLHFHHRAFSVAAAAFDGFEAAQDEENDINITAQDDPPTETKEEEEQEEIRPSLASEEGKLYVGNLPYSMTSSDLQDVFQEAGRVVNVEVIYDRVTDRSRGFGFVTMGSVEEAKEAIRMFNGSLVGGRTVRVNFPEVPKGGEREVMGQRIQSTYKGFIDSPHKIYAGNLDWRLTSQGLRDAFTDQPGMLSAKVIYERDTGRSRGFGFISFESADNAEAALNAMNGVEVEGRPLRLNLAEQRARPSPTLETNLENSVESSELFSSIGS